MALIVNSSNISPAYHISYEGTPLKQIDVVQDGSRYTVWRYASLKVGIQIPDDYSPVIISLNGVETTYSSGGMFTSEFDDGDELIVKTQYGTIHQETLSLSKSYNYVVIPQNETLQITVKCVYKEEKDVLLNGASWTHTADMPSMITSAAYVSQWNNVNNNLIPGTPTVVLDNNRLSTNLLVLCGQNNPPAAGTCNITYRFTSNAGGSATVTFGGSGSWTKTYDVNLTYYGLVEEA